MGRMAFSLRMWAPGCSPQRLAGHGGHIEIQQVLLGQLCLHRGDAAGGIQVRHVGGACGSQMAEVRGAGADLIEELQVHRHACLIGNGQQVEDGVGGAAQSHIAGQCVADGALVDDLAGRDALFLTISIMAMPECLASCRRLE